jgi:hypothetical protein
LSRISSAFRAFFSILGGSLPADLAREFGYVRAAAAKTAAAEAQAKPSDGALQLLGILQREARLVDFLMEDIAAYDDEQVGAAVRTVHEQSRAALLKCVKLAPVIDGVEGAFAKPDAAGAIAKDAAAIKFTGNLPPQGKPAGGLLRHKGWRADTVTLPSIGRQNMTILAPAELEVE